MTKFSIRNLTNKAITLPVPLNTYNKYDLADDVPMPTKGTKVRLDPDGIATPVDDDESRYDGVVHRIPCEHCSLSYEEHGPGEKCLFEATRFTFTGRISVSPTTISIGTLELDAAESE